jgi:hypothetical protein
MQNQINGLTDEKNVLNEKLSAANDFDAQMSPRIIRDAMKGKSTVMFRTPDASEDDVAALSRLVEEAGGVVTGTITLTQEFVDANSSEKLLSVINSPIVPAGRQLSTTSVDQGTQAGDLLGIALLTGKDQNAPAVGDADRDAVARFAAGLAPHGAGTLLAGRDGSATGTGAVSVVRSDASLTNAVGTVDDVERPSGRITAVLGLQEMTNGGRPGQYGIGRGASSVTLAQ